MSKGRFAQMGSALSRLLGDPDAFEDDGRRWSMPEEGEPH